MIKVHGLMGVSIPYLKAASAINGYLIAKVPVAAKLTMDIKTRKMRIEMPALKMVGNICCIINCSIRVLLTLKH